MADASFILTPARAKLEGSWLDLPVKRTTADEYEAGLRAFYGRPIRIKRYPASGTAEEKEAFTEDMHRMIGSLWDPDHEEEASGDETDSEYAPEPLPAPIMGEFYSLPSEDLEAIMGEAEHNPPPDLNPPGIMA